MKLSIIVPCYNEKNTIEKIINKILNEKKIIKEIILVDDFSNDGSREIIKHSIKKELIKLFFTIKIWVKEAALSLRYLM